MLSGRLLPASLAGPCLPDPPRCCVDLQRVTVVSSWFVRLPSSACALFPFGLDPGVFETTAASAIARDGLSPLMALRSPSRTSTSSSSVPLARLTIRRALDPSCSLGVSRPSDAPSPGDPCPGGPVHASNYSAALRGLASPRASTPASSAFAVFRDLGGLIPPEPGDLFQPLTSMGLRFPCPSPKREVVGCELQASGWRRSPCHRGGPASGSAAPDTEVSIPAPAPQRFLPARPSRGHRSVRSFGGVAFPPVVPSRRLRRSVPFRPSGSPRRRSDSVRADSVRWSCPCCPVWPSDAGFPSPPAGSTGMDPCGPLARPGRAVAVK